MNLRKTANHGRHGRFLRRDRARSARSDLLRQPDVTLSEVQLGSDVLLHEPHLHLVPLRFRQPRADERAVIPRTCNCHSLFETPQKGEGEIEAVVVVFVVAAF